MPIEYDFARDPVDHGDGRGYEFTLVAHDPSAPDGSPRHGGTGHTFYHPGPVTTANMYDLAKAELDRVLPADQHRVDTPAQLDADGNEVAPAVMADTPRKQLRLWHRLQREKAAPVAAKLRKVEVEKVKDGKTIKESVDDRRVDVDQ